MNQARGYVILCGMLLSSAYIVNVHTYVFDMEVRGPEHEQLDRDTRDRENSDANDRVNTGNSGPGDAERANQFDRDHMG